MRKSRLKKYMVKYCETVHHFYYKYVDAQNYESAWLYILAPVLGMLLAIPVCRLIQEPEFYSAKGKKNDT